MPTTTRRVLLLFVLAFAAGPGCSSSESIQTVDAPVSTSADGAVAHPDAAIDARAAGTDAPTGSPDALAPSADAPENAADAPMVTADAPVAEADAPIVEADAPMAEADAPAAAIDAPAPIADAPEPGPDGATGCPSVCMPLDQCHAAGTCDVGTGQCTNPPLVDGTPCNDADLCTAGDVCTGGVCGGTATVCTASDACHLAGTCDPGTGLCSDPAAPDGTACSDGDACTMSDGCMGGVCTGSNPVVCACQQSTCNPASGQCSACPVTCPTATWAKGYDTPLPGGVAVDPAGNAYVTGAFAGAIDFGAGLLSSAGSADVYVLRLNPATGAAMWSIRGGDTEDQYGDNLAADGAGHVIVVGRFTGTLAFGGSAASLTSSTESIYVAGFNAATGGALWARKVSLGGGTLNGVAVDASDSGVVVVGNTAGGAIADFGDGPIVGSSDGGQDIVVAKLNPASGSVTWAKQLGGASDQTASAVQADGAGHVFVTGRYGGTLDFGNGALPTVTDPARFIFVARLASSNGAGQASRAFGMMLQPTSAAIAVDGNGEAAIAGTLVGTIDFGSGTPLQSAGGSDVFVAKLSADLATTRWAVRFGDPMSQSATGVTFDDGGNVVVAGNFRGTLALVPAATLTSTGNFDAFVATLDGATGAPACAAAATDDTGKDQSVKRIAVTGSTQYVIGTFLGKIKWDGLPEVVQPDGSIASSTYFVKRQ